jgi:hypothetical protein
MVKQNNEDQIFLTPYESIPEKWEKAREFFIEELRKIVDGINSRDNGTYIDFELPNGQQWFKENQTDLKNGFRKVVKISLPNFGVTNPYTKAHGITTTQNMIVTRLYGCATDPGASTLTSAIPLPFLDMFTGNHISLEIDQTNIILRSLAGGNYSAYTNGYVVIEYIDEV